MRLVHMACMEEERLASDGDNNDTVAQVLRFSTG